MATKAQAEAQLKKYGIKLEEVIKDRLEGYFGWIDAPEGFYLNSTGLHLSSVHGWNMPDFWDSVVENSQEGIKPCSSGGCEAHECDNRSTN